MVLPIGLSATLLLGWTIGCLCGYSGVIRKNYWNIHEIQQEYVVPNKLEIIVEDLDKTDGKGIPETYLKYNEKSYALTLDEQGKPRIQDYEYKPIEIKPAEIMLKK
ncbi:MAG: hypothetical protein ABIJ14_03045 [Nanoarchaeota archaeon]|nr:hypothetical protein [Nanoarchaeota archaeon]